LDGPSQIFDFLVDHSENPRSIVVIIVW